MRHADFDHLKIVMISSNGTTEEITENVVSMNVHEDIFSAGIYGTLTIEDTDSVLERLEIKGEDKLNIEFSSGAKDGFYLFHKIFDIVSIEKVTAAHKNQIYNIRFQSQFIYAANSYLMSVYVQGKTDEIVKDIYESHVRYDEPLIMETCLYYRQFVIPRWTPLKTIQYLTRTAQSNTNQENQNYVFFERSDGFMFFSMEGLMDLGAKEIIQFKKLSEKEIEKNVVLRHVVQKWYDRDSLMNHGYFGSTVYGIDQNKNTFTVTQKTRIDTQNPAWTYSSQMTQTICANQDNNAGIHDWGHKSNAAWNNLSVDVEILGNTNLTVGDSVQLTFPTYIFGEYNMTNKMLPDQWLITHVKHQFFEGEYRQILNLRSNKWKI